MSKRLLASKASKRGRMLRPRSERRPSSPGIAGENEPESGDRESSVPSDAPISLNSEAAPERVTVPEGSLPPTAPVAREADAPRAVEAKLATESSDDEPPLTAKSHGEPKPVLIEIARVDAATIDSRRAAEALADATSPTTSPDVNDEPVKVEVATPEPIKVEVVKADPVKAEPVKAEPVKVEPVKAEPVKVEIARTEPAKVVAKTETVKVEVAKTETAKTSSEPLSKKKKKQQQQEAARKAAEASAKGGVPAHDEDDHELSSHHFFQSPTDSLLPLVDAGEPEVDEHERHAPPTAESLAHRAKLKKIVGGVLAAAAVVALIGIGKTALGSKSASASQSRDSHQVADKAAAQAAASDDAKKAADAKAAADEKAAAEAKKANDAAKAEADAKLAAAKDDGAKPADDAKAAAEDAAKKDADKAADDAQKKDDDKKKEDDAKAAAAPSGDAKELKKKAAIAINSGNNKAAIETAKAALVADPEDAMMYLYLGSAYLNLGDSKGAREAFNDCAKNAKTGPKYECIQMGGHK